MQSRLSQTDRVVPVLLLGLSFVWGTSFLLIKIADAAMSPSWVASLRLALGAIFVWAVALARRERVVFTPGRWAHMALLAFFATAGPFILLAWAETKVPSGVAGVINATTPLWTMALAAALLPAERLSGGGVAWMTGAFIGVVGILSPWSSSAASLWGDVACLVAAFSYAIGFVYTKVVVQPWGVPATSLTAVQLSLATLEAGVAIPLVGARFSVAPGHLAALLVLGAINTGAAFIAYHMVVRRAGATRSSTVTYLSPVVALILGVTLRGEHLGWSAYLGSAVLLICLAGAGGHLGIPKRPAVQLRGGGEQDPLPTTDRYEVSDP